jgi:hypothetical protein
LHHNFLAMGQVVGRGKQSQKPQVCKTDTWGTCMGTPTSLA